MNETDANSVMTVREISEFLRLTEATVYKLLNEGKLPGRKVGGQWRCSRYGWSKWLYGNFLPSEDLGNKEVLLIEE